MAKETTLKQSKEAKLKEIDEILGNPVFVSFTDDVLKIRRNMLVFSFIAAGIVFSGATLEEEIAPLGIKLGNVNIEHVLIGLLCILAYHVIHFFWNSLDILQHWRIRLTGTWFSSPEDNYKMQGYEDNSSHPERHSLYWYWSKTRDELPDIRSAIENFRNETNKIKTHKIVNPIHSGNISDYEAALLPLNKVVNNMESKLSNLSQRLSSPRIEASLKNFDQWFWRFQKSQSLRWIILEFGGPLAFGVISCCLLLWTIFCRSTTEISGAPLLPA